MSAALSAPEEWPALDAEMTDEDFHTIVAMVRKGSGIVLNERKRHLVHGRLRRRLRQLRIENFRDYLTYLAGPNGSDEQVRMINAITTNLTAFFREGHHFDFLANRLLPNLPRGTRRLRIWSAGCSSGEEPYSIAMTLHRAMPDLPQWDAKILATDIDTDMVAHGAAGRYEPERAATIPAELARQHTRRMPGGKVEMGPELKAMITFRQLNLLGAWPMGGPFDAIFCRNVVIYFDKPTQRVLFDRFADMLAPHGILFVGHSETLVNVCDRFAHVERTAHRRLR